MVVEIVINSVFALGGKVGRRLSEKERGVVERVIYSVIVLCGNVGRRLRERERRWF